VIAALDKARPSLPIKPLPKKEPSDDNILKNGAKGAKVVKAVKSVIKLNIHTWSDELNLCELMNELISLSLSLSLSL